MNPPRFFPRAQQGVALVVGLIMLALLSLMVASAFLGSTGNLQSVQNVQAREEAKAAADFAVERLLDGFMNTTPLPVGGPPAETSTVDINGDGTDDYTVNIVKPQCKQIIDALVPRPEGTGSSDSLGEVFQGGVAYYTLWEITATAQDPQTGVSVTLQQGVNVMLSKTDAQTYCPGMKLPT